MQKMTVMRFIISAIGMIGLVILTFSAKNLDLAYAQSSASRPLGYTWDGYISQCDPECSSMLSQAAVPEGEFLIVSNTSEEINGNISNPAALTADPGPDGISLSEAITAAEGTSEFDIIRFDPSLKGSVINLRAGLPVISRGNLMIDGNIDDDTTPDITIDGTNSARNTGFILYGASHVVIKGFDVRNFDKNGISISPDTAAGKAVVEDISLHQNMISGTVMNTIELNIWQQNHAAIRNVEIVSNTLHNSGGGVAVHAGMGEGASDNQISGVSVRYNTIDNPGYNIAVFISPASSSNLSRNTVRNIEIRGNQIRNHLNTSVLIDSSNQVACNDNTTEGVIIADNIIDGEYVTIEIVGESGMYSTGNLIKNLSITGNVLTRGGIQVSGATGYIAHDNTISTVLIERNHVSSCLANGIYLIAGSGGAYHNLLENVTLRSNSIHGCADAGILLHGDTSWSPNNTINNVTITNQTLVNNGNSWAGGLNVNTKDASNTITGVSFTNSILWGNDGADAIRGALVPGVVAYNLLGDSRFVGTNNNFYQDPQFVDPTSGDYHLQSTSSCVDTGDPSASSVGAKDLDNHIRLWDGDNDNLAIVDRGALEYNAIAMQEMKVRGNGISINNGDVVPTIWDATDFGAAALAGTPVEQTFTIENTGAADLSLTGDLKVEITGTNAGDFTVISQPGSQIPGGESVTFIIEFVPQATGLREAAVSIANDDSDENPYTFAIQGTGTAFASEPEMNVRGNGISIFTGDILPATSDATDFGDAAAAGEPVRHTFTIENTGVANLILTGDPRVEIAGAHAGDFSVISQPRSQIAGGESVTFTIEFAHSEAGLREATVRIENDDDDENPYTFAIQGTGTVQIIKLYLPLVMRLKP
jgi:hypothetical protein